MLNGGASYLLYNLDMLKEDMVAMRASAQKTASDMSVLHTELATYRQASVTLRHENADLKMRNNMLEAEIAFMREEMQRYNT